MCRSEVFKSRSRIRVTLESSDNGLGTALIPVQAHVTASRGGIEPIDKHTIACPPKKLVSIHSLVDYFDMNDQITSNCQALLATCLRARSAVYSQQMSGLDVIDKGKSSTLGANRIDMRTSA